MNILFLKIILKYINFLPCSILNLFLFNSHELNKSIIIFDTIQYKLEYKGNNLVQFYFPLVINISQISKEIYKIFKKDKIVSIISVLVFHESNSKIEYRHSLSMSNKLYTLSNYNEWSINILFNLIEKLEFYNSFNKISLIIKIKTVTKI